MFKVVHIRGNGSLVSSDSENARTYYHYACDSLGSITHVIAGNEFGNGGADGGVNSRILCRYGYDAFGNTVDAEETIKNRYGFTGEMHDDITDMYYLRARYYAPYTGRFTQADTYHGDGLNLYVYAGNNPVKYVDPSGHCSKDNGVEGGKNSIINQKGVEYPQVTDLRTGQNMEFPDNIGSRVPKEDRVGWYRNQSEANLYRVNDTDILCKKDYIDEWYRRGYQTPEGGWNLYEIHHIKPREFGGGADFENMTPVLKDIHRKIVTPWWNAY